MSNRDFVFHLAGRKGSVKVTVEKPADYFVPMLMANTNVLETARMAGVKKLVYTSSIGAYGSYHRSLAPNDIPSLFEGLEREWWDNIEPKAVPMDAYPGWAKRMGELQIQAYFKQYGLSNFVPLRMTACYGPGDNFESEDSMVITSLLGKLHRGERRITIWGDGKAERDWLFSRDAAEGILLAAIHGQGPNFINLGTGEGHTVKELVETLQGIVPFKATYDTSQPSGFSRRVMDITLAKEKLGFKSSTSLEEGLKETWESLQNGGG